MIRPFIILMLSATTFIGCVDSAPGSASSDESNVDVDDASDDLVDAGRTGSVDEVVNSGRSDGGSPAPFDAGPAVDTGSDEDGRPHGAEPSDAGRTEEPVSDAELYNGRD